MRIEAPKYLNFFLWSEFLFLEEVQTNLFFWKGGGSKFFLEGVPKKIGGALFFAIFFFLGVLGEKKWKGGKKLFWRSNFFWRGMYFVGTGTEGSKGINWTLVSLVNI